MSDTYRDAQRRAVLPPIAKPRKAFADPDSPLLIHAQIDDLLFAFWTRERGQEWTDARRKDWRHYCRDWGLTYRNLTGEDCPQSRERGGELVFAPSHIDDPAKLQTFRTELRIKLGFEVEGRESKCS